MKDEDKFSKIFATLLLLEEHQRIMKYRIDELSTYRMAQRATNLVQLLASERRDVDQDLAYIREILNAAPAPHPAPEAKQEPVAWVSVEDRLPLVCSMVLVYCAGFSFADTAVFQGSGKWAFGDVADQYWDEVKNPVTHWMPLPANPVASTPR